MAEDTAFRALSLDIGKFFKIEKVFHKDLLRRGAFAVKRRRKAFFQGQVVKQDRVFV
jgi:hypothetical protein